MDYMVMEFPDDVRERMVREGRNISETERWVSVAAGVGLAAYGVSRRSGAGWMLAGLGALLVRRGMSGHCHTYSLFGMNTAGTGSDTRQALGGSAGVIVEESITINRPIEELYRFWRNLENLPRVMSHLQSVERITDTLSRWRAKGPAGTEVEWNAEIINDVANQVIGWRSIEGSDVVSAGSINFDEAGAGRARASACACSTALRAGRSRTQIARWLGRDAATEIREDLERFKQIVETGEETRS